VSFNFKLINHRLLVQWQLNPPCQSNLPRVERHSIISRIKKNLNVYCYVAVRRVPCIRKRFLRSTHPLNCGVMPLVCSGPLAINSNSLEAKLLQLIVALLQLRSRSYVHHQQTEHQYHTECNGKIFSIFTDSLSCLFHYFGYFL